MLKPKKFLILVIIIGVVGIIIGGITIWFTIINLL